MIADNKLNPVGTEPFIRGRKPDSIYHTILFWCIKNIKLNSMHYFIVKILNKWELQQITFNQLWRLC